MTDESLSHVRATLAGDFESIAEWRALKADEYPGDDRYTNAIEGLRRLATNVLALPGDDMRLHVIDAAWSYGCDPTAPDILLRMYGFGPGSHRGVPDADAFFRRYADEWASQLELESGITKNFNLSFLPSVPNGFGLFIRNMVEAFRFSIEQQDGWRLLWYKGRSRGERTVQACFRMVATHYCRANKIDITGEANAGRGPVDFKFTQNWHSRAIIEIKLMRNSGLWNGILAQLPQYARSEEIKAAVLVAIAYTEPEMAPSRIQKVRRAAVLASSANSIDIAVVIIDARQKKSASELKASQSERDALHDRQD